jgi:hypothetical protein
MASMSIIRLIHIRIDPSEKERSSDSRVLACPNVRLGLSLSSHGRRSCDRPHSAIENSPVPSQNFIRLKKLNDSQRLETILHPRWHTPFLGGAGLPQVAGRRSG